MLVTSSKRSTIRLEPIITQMNHIYKEPGGPLVLATNFWINFFKNSRYLITYQKSRRFVKPLRKKRPSSTENLKDFLLNSSHQSDWIQQSMQQKIQIGLFPIYNLLNDKVLEEVPDIAYMTSHLSSISSHLRSMKIFVSVSANTETIDLA